MTPGTERPAVTCHGPQRLAGPAVGFPESPLPRRIRVLFISEVHRSANVQSVAQPRPDAIGTVRRHPAVRRLIAVQHRRARHDDLTAAHQLPASIRVHAPLVGVGRERGVQREVTHQVARGRDPGKQQPHRSLDRAFHLQRIPAAVLNQATDRPSRTLHHRRHSITSSSRARVPTRRMRSLTTTSFGIIGVIAVTSTSQQSF